MSNHNNSVDLAASSSNAPTNAAAPKKLLNRLFHPLIAAFKSATKELTPPANAPFNSSILELSADEIASIFAAAQHSGIKSGFLETFADGLFNDPEQYAPQISPRLLQEVVDILKISFASYASLPPAIEELCESCCEFLITSTQYRRDLITPDRFNEIIELHNSVDHEWGRERLQSVLCALIINAPDFDNVPLKAAVLLEKNAFDSTKSIGFRDDAIETLLVIGHNCDHLITEDIMHSLERISLWDANPYIRGKAAATFSIINEVKAYPNDLPLRRLMSHLRADNQRFQTEDYSCE
jgi:hypothetical protein